MLLADQENHMRLKLLFEQVCDLPAQRRDQRIAVECRDDPALLISAQ